MRLDQSNPLCCRAVTQAIVIDSSGRQLTPCSIEKAQRLLAQGKVTLIAQDPLTIRLQYPVAERAVRPVEECRLPGENKAILLHICCGPCGTYTIQRLREQGFEVRGFWYNPNIHPYDEHERRRACVEDYAREVGLPMTWWREYEDDAYFSAVRGHEAFGERCAICYRLRLERTAQVAAMQGCQALTTTLLISPYQNQEMIRQIGSDVAQEHDLEFYFENFRRGWAERGRTARQHGLYQQRYCGCIYSAEETRAQNASR